MTPADVLGVLVLAVAAVICAMELLLWSNVWAEIEDDDLVTDDRPDTTPDPYVVGSESDPFAVDVARFRR